MTQGVSGLLGLRGPLESGDVDPLRAYFSSEDVGGWKDFSSAGYLLANAFRTSSSTPPDNLPSVKVRLGLFSHSCPLWGLSCWLSFSTYIPEILFTHILILNNIEMESFWGANRCNGKELEEEGYQECTGCL